MQDLNIADAGFTYIFNCISYYYEGNIYFLLYIVSLIFLCAGKVPSACASGKAGEEAVRAFRKRMREIFLPQFVFMVLTVYNPVFPVILNSFFDVNKEYYRFLWMSPVIICICTAGVTAVWGSSGDGKDIDAKSKNGSGSLHNTNARVREVIAAAFLVCLLMAGGSYLYKDGYILSPDIYHMPSEIPEISEIIHEDAGSRLPARLEAAEASREGWEPEHSGKAYPMAMFEYDYQMQIRQYDAGILLACDREQYMRALAGEVTYETAMEEGNYIDRLLAVTALGIQIDKDRFISALEHTGTEYVIVTTASGKVPYLKKAGLSVVGETANHTVMHYEPEEPRIFELADYNEVWRLTPQWYDFLL